MKIALSAAALMMATNCSDSPYGLRGVTAKAYLDFASCWTGDDNRFAAFLILDQNRRGFRPYFVSSRCYVTEFGGDTTMGYLGDLKVAGDNSGLKARAGLTGEFLSNTVADIGPPADQSRVYLFSGDLVRRAVEGYPDARVYDIAKVDRLIDTKMPFARFRKLTREERFSLFQALNRAR